jgi:predicted nucleic acid-binding Zn ribbon protein
MSEQCPFCKTTIDTGAIACSCGARKIMQSDAGWFELARLPLFLVFLRS